MKKRTCSRCGCSYYNPCIDTRTGMTCAWVGPRLCSFCEKPAERRAREKRKVK